MSFTIALVDKVNWSHSELLLILPQVPSSLFNLTAIEVNQVMNRYFNLREYYFAAAPV